jgi:hypothetical protein
VRQRVALKTGVGLDKLQDAESLQGEELEQVEEAVKAILGLQELHI